MKRYLCLDISNLLYRTFFSNKKDDEFTIAGLAHHAALTTINKYYRNFRPNQIIMCFDRPSWRKKYTKSDECISKKPYKGNRRQKMTPKDWEKYQHFMDHLTEFEHIMRDHTSIVTLSKDGLEADDLIAGFTQMYASEDAEVIIVSGDQDLIQLLRYSNVRLINPASGKERTLKDWNDDADLFIFEKCIRGDITDNVQSALPRCRKTRIWKAYQDEFERINLMNKTWTNIHGEEFIVKDLFKENQKLMDLTCQPEDIRKDIIKTIIEETRDPGTFSYFHFMKFLGKYELKKIAEQAENFVNMLNS